jgi:hypothetical protein
MSLCWRDVLHHKAIDTDQLSRCLLLTYHPIFFADPGRTSDSSTSALSLRVFFLHRLFWRKCYSLCLQTVDVEQLMTFAIARYAVGSSPSRHNMKLRDFSTVRLCRDLASVSL